MKSLARLTVAAKYCSASSIEVNERVITMLVSSAAAIFKVTVDKDSSGCPSAQVTAMVLRSRSFSSMRAASSTSEVWPEREIKTGT